MDNQNQAQPITDPQSSDTTSNVANDTFHVVADQPLDPTADNQKILARQTPSGTSRGVQQLGSPAIYADSGNNQIIVEDKTVPTVLMGNQAMFGDGFYVSRPGIDVTTNTDPSKLIFNSNQDALKVVAKGSVVTTNDGTTVTTTTIPHNLGFAPIPFAFIGNATVNGVSGGFFVPLPTYGSASIDTTNHVINFQTYLSCYTDTVNVNIQTINSTGLPSSLTITYYLLQETASAT